LSETEKQYYEEKAAQERIRVVEAQKKQNAMGIVFETTSKTKGGTGTGGSSSNTSNLDPMTLIFPLARIRKITKLDREVGAITKEALALITKATELSLARLGTEAVKVAAMQNRRKLLPEDVVTVTKTRNEFAFLKDDLKDLVEEQMMHAAATGQDSSNGGDTGNISKKRKASGASALPVQTNNLTSYFAMEDHVVQAVKKAAVDAMENTQNNNKNATAAEAALSTKKRKAPPALPVQSNKLTSYFSKKPRTPGEADSE
jgi:histone H3/H4